VGDALVACCPDAGKRTHVAPPGFYGGTAAQLLLWRVDKNVTAAAGFARERGNRCCDRAGNAKCNAMASEYPLRNLVFRSLTDSARHHRNCLRRVGRLGAISLLRFAAQCLATFLR